MLKFSTEELMLLKSGAGGLLRVPWTARRSNQSMLKEINPEYSLEGLILKLQSSGHLMQRANSLEKALMLGKTKGRRRRRWQRMRWLDGIIDSMDVSLSKVWDTVKDRKAWCATVHGIVKNQTPLSNWITKVCHSFPSKEQVSFNFMAAITVSNNFGTQEYKICHCFHFSTSICHEVMVLDAMILVLWMLSFKPAFSLSSFTLIKRLFSSSCFLSLEWYHPHIWGCWYFSCWVARYKKIILLVNKRYFHLFLLKLSHWVNSATLGWMLNLSNTLHLS